MSKLPFAIVSAVNKKDLEALAECRMKDVQVLFSNRRFDGAYYLSGYVVECALKVCIAKKTRRYDFPPERKIIDQVYSHDLTRLVEAAGLKARLELEFQTDPTLEVKWGVVKDWKETSRYAPTGRRRAKDMIDAVAGPQGVYACLKKYW